MEHCKIGLGFGVLGLGFRVWCWVWGLGFWVWGLGFRVQGWGSGFGPRAAENKVSASIGLGFSLWISACGFALTTCSGCWGLGIKV